jgi:acyl-CoA synthetase (AMP-forming)/AMP-acid ligase II
MAADAVPDREALVVGDQRRTYAELDDRVRRLANHLAGQGIGQGDHVALYLENCAEYLEAMLAAFTLRAVPINVNHRYVADELRYLLDNSDSVAVITQPSLAATMHAVVGSGNVPAVRFTLVTGDEYDAALAAAADDRRAIARSDDDHYIIYTGGTTGTPKGVVWRQVDAFYACIGGGDPMRLFGVVERPDELPGRIAEHPICFLPLAPMMHAAAQWTSLGWLFSGSKVVLMPGSLDPDAVWLTVEREQVNGLTVVGDAVARPLLDAWDRAGGYDVTSLFTFSNGGAPMSPSTRERVFATLPAHVGLADGFGSSEAGTQVSMRVSAKNRPADDSPVRFNAPAKPTIVVDDDGHEVIPGSGAVGHVLAGGRLPLGYYNDPDKTAATFVERDGQRWLVTGDVATVTADGSIELRGRGAVSINTGGEKVFPEEVEEALKTYPGIRDAVAVGIPDDRFGEAVTAVGEVADGADVEPDAVIDHVRSKLAVYKAPKRVFVIDTIGRAPNGKVDYKGLTAWAREQVA